MVEYLFGYDPNVVTTASMKLIISSFPTLFNPTQSGTAAIVYLLNKDATVTVSFTNTTTSEVVRVLADNVTAGLNTIVWDGKDTSGEIVEKGDYSVSINVNDGLGHIINNSPGTVELYYVHDISNLYCNPSRIIPANNELTTIGYNITVDANVVIGIYDPCGILFATINEFQRTVSNPQQVIWYGRNKAPENPDGKYPFKEGTYTVKVKFAGMRENETTTLTIYK